MFFLALPKKRLEQTMQKTLLPLYVHILNSLIQQHINICEKENSLNVIYELNTAVVLSLTKRNALARRL